MSDLIRRLGALSARRPWLTILAWAVLTTSVLGLAGTVGGAFADDVSAPGSESARAMELLELARPEPAALTGSVR